LTAIAVPKLIIHGGAGSTPDSKGTEAWQALHRIVTAVYALLESGESAAAAAVRACTLLEDEPCFNAGTGSVLQSDGQIRMSAALMEGEHQCFSGVINVARVQNPILMARALQGQPDRVLSDRGAAELARELGLPVYDPLTEARLQEWLGDRRQGTTKRMAEVTMGTIGAVALDRQGRLCVGTSTGGRGFERIGRVSDSATPAGTYANAQAAISCTGVGEDILDEGLATRIVVRVTDGMTLREAVERSMAEGVARRRDFGAIGVAADGAIAWGKTTSVLFAAYHDGEKSGDTRDA